MRLPACIHVVSPALSELNTRATLLCFEYAIPIRSSTLVRLLTLNSTTVIILIAAEILVAAVNIVVDLYAGVD